MTFRETTTPSTGTEPAAQSCDDDPCGLDDIPAFLRRKPTQRAPGRAGETLRLTPDQE